MHRQSPLDWVARVVMLALAGMVSLSIIGSIAAIPSGSIEGRIGIDQSQPSSPEPTAEDRSSPTPTPEATPSAEPGPGQISIAAPAPPERPDPARWLEAITYALLALVGLSALATLLLWRGLRERRRIADALEILSSRP
jgi:hypothetical protein